MDYFGVPYGTIRAKALDKLTTLSVSKSQFINNEDDSLKRIASVITVAKQSEISSVPVAFKEVQILLGLSKCCSTVEDYEKADLIFRKIIPYFLEIPNHQEFTNASILRLEPNPWNLLTKNLTNGIIELSAKFPKISSETIDLFLSFLSQFDPSNRSEYKFFNFFSLCGFLEAITENPKIFKQSTGSKILESVISLFSDDFLNIIEQTSEHESAVLSVQFTDLVQRIIISYYGVLVNCDKENLSEFLLEQTARKIDRIRDENNDIIEDGSILTENIELSDKQIGLITKLTNFSLSQIESIEEGAQYISLSTDSRLYMVYCTKAHALQSLSFSFHMNILPFNDERLSNILFNSFSHPHGLKNHLLCSTLVSVASLLCFKDPVNAGEMLSRFYPLLIVSPDLQENIAKDTAKSLALGSKALPQENVISTVYSLINLITVNQDGTPTKPILKSSGTHVSVYTPPQTHSSNHPSNGNAFTNGLRSYTINSAISINDYIPPQTESDLIAVCIHIFKNVVNACSQLVRYYDNDNITALVITLLSQKMNQSLLVPLLVDGLAKCAPYSQERQFKILMRLYRDLANQSFPKKKPEILTAVTNARILISKLLGDDHPLYQVYLHELLTGIISKGDVQKDEHHRSHSEISRVATEISQFLKPLAHLLPDVSDPSKDFSSDLPTVEYFKNVWYNMVVHGYSLNSELKAQYSDELERIAHSSPPLASESSWNRTETSLELNSVLRRGSSSHNIRHQKEFVDDICDTNLIQIHAISTAKVMFLAAAVFLESLRVKSGNCSTALIYFSDPSIKISQVEEYIGSLAVKITSKFVDLIAYGGNNAYSIENIAIELKKMLVLCCHREKDLQASAFQCCEILISRIPSSLCHHKSLFTMLDILTLLFQSIVDADADEYEPRFTFRLKNSDTTITVSDSLKWRKKTFQKFYEKARKWVRLSLLRCNQDMKSLLQSYISTVDKFKRVSQVELGISFALEMAGTILPSDKELSNIPQASNVNTVSGFLSQFSWTSSFKNDIIEKLTSHSVPDAERLSRGIRSQLLLIKDKLANHEKVSEAAFISSLEDSTELVILSSKNNAELVRLLVHIPFAIFTSDSMKVGVGLWLTLIKEKPGLSSFLLSHIAAEWEVSIRQRKGLFSNKFDLAKPEFCYMKYLPSDKNAINHSSHIAIEYLEPHAQLIHMLQSHFQATMYQSDHLLKIFTRIVLVGLRNFATASLHPFSRLVRFELIKLSIDILNVHIKLGSRYNYVLMKNILLASLSWFKRRGSFPYGGNQIRTKTDYDLLQEIASSVSNMRPPNSLVDSKLLLLTFLHDELNNIACWLNPLDPAEAEGIHSKFGFDEKLLTAAYKLDPLLAINFTLRFKTKSLNEGLRRLLLEDPISSINYPDAIQYLVSPETKSINMYQLLFWKPSSVIDCINLLLLFSSNPYIIQYSFRSLEIHDVNLTFFYVPQIVQALRYDSNGYVERFILETAKVSQLFAHQIIWNMKANSYKDDEATIPDTLKPALDRILKSMLSSFDKEDLQFFKREFSFFEDITGISGKLKPYIKKTKAEKKAKIDEEMAKIVIQPDVYLPSNPDGVIVNINRQSGKPLQSHAKAPFMASFKIRKEVHRIEEDDDLEQPAKCEPEYEETWLGAIFKVGDDCRQDVLALQLISVFRTIWENSGLDLFVFPYRVTATAPGCGVIDVLPNSISRDMLGREAVNGLYQYFITRFGPETSIEFQEARNNFVKSLAAYSVISYLLQFKDRHNGNIMYDDKGHILHIDFGFCFDIVPGGVKFEQSPFKLTREMIDVLGGGRDTQAFRWFEELCVKGFLAARPYMEIIVRCTIPMLDSGLPCFKPSTIKNLRSRFIPNKSEKEAARHMKRLINKSYESLATKGYDEFQRLTNGIPY
ncbi:hypothetical protein PACTADRAFT_85014 [Pachysolen tannophilus NRRL Y-2460]|uniref:1-phosphatidylinositol 4-kinase n=1 Tax=Pachysolen tannophilus NRRL Y-2460 TaxID=669874 RepID=A0A1E4TWV0_PACTA|nr:hypothetical protein PACTADRAFT_85014 [Pachysolen tannophilus NRRL Y-2460]